MDSQNHKNSSFQTKNHFILTDFAFGTLGGFIGKGILYPFEKTQKMVSERAFFRPFARNEAYFRVIPKIYQEGGISAFFAGWAPATIKFSLNLGSTLAFFYQIKEALYPKATLGKKDISIKENILCASLASLAGYLIFTPVIEYGKTHTPLNKAPDFIQKNDFLRVYRFWQTDIPKALLRRGLVIGLIESKINRQQARMRGKKIPWFVNFVDAYSFALFGGILSYPFQKMKEISIKINSTKPQENPEDPTKTNRVGFKPLLKGISTVFVTQISTALALTVFYKLLEKSQNQTQVY